jgi:hypothetical protein
MKLSTPLEKGCCPLGSGLKVPLVREHEGAERRESTVDEAMALERRSLSLAKGEVATGPSWRRVALRRGSTVGPRRSVWKKTAL